jgi:hypothetical protein
MRRVHLQPGPERLGLAVPQAGQVAQPLALKKGEQGRQADLVRVGICYQGQPVSQGYRHV